MDVGSVSSGSSVESTMLAKMVMKQNGPNILTQTLNKTYEEALKSESTKSQIAQLTGKGLNVDKCV